MIDNEESIEIPKSKQTLFLKAQFAASRSCHGIENIHVQIGIEDYQNLPCNFHTNFYYKKYQVQRIAVTFSEIHGLL